MRTSSTSLTTYTMGSIDSGSMALNGGPNSAKDGVKPSSLRPGKRLSELFSENITAKILRTADKLLVNNVSRPQSFLEPRS